MSDLIITGYSTLPPTNITFLWNNLLNSISRTPAWANRYTNAGSMGEFLSASKASLFYPISNIQNKQRTKIWKTDTGETSVRIEIDFGLNQAPEINVIGLVNHNLSPTATVKIWIHPQVTAATSDEITNETYEATSIYVHEHTMDSPVTEIVQTLYGADDYYGIGGYEYTITSTSDDYEPMSSVPVVFFLGSTDSQGTIPAGRHVMIQIIDGTNSDDFVRLGRLYLGTYYESSINYFYGSSHSLEDLSTSTTSQGGVTWTNRKSRRNKLDLNFGQVDDSDKFNRFLRNYFDEGINDYFIICTNPGTSFGLAMQNYYGSFDNSLSFSQVRPDGHELSCSFKEEL